MANRWNSTTLVDPGYGADDINKSLLDLLAKTNTVNNNASSYPVGAIVQQYSGQPTPASLYGGTWTNITSTLPQSVTATIYDSGTNANGNWIRWTDGTMECYWAVPITTLSFTATEGNLFVGSTQTWTFPQTFISQPTFQGGPIVSNALGYQWIVQNSTATTSSVAWNTMATRAGTATSGTVNISAIGKWSAPVYPTTYWQKGGTNATTGTPQSITTDVYDTGTNANGSWFRYNNGVMFCWGVGGDSGSGATTRNAIVVYPIPFASVPSPTFICNWAAILVNVGISGGTYSNLGFTATYTSTSAGAGGFNIFWQAMGKWR